MVGDEKILIAGELDKLLDHFFYCFGVRILFSSPAGRILRVGLESPDSAFCRMVRSELGREGRCLAQDERMRTVAEERGGILPYTCHAGLRECLYPIIKDGHLLGFAMIGQYRRSSAPPERLRAAWRDAAPRGHAASGSARGERALAEAFAALPAFDAEGEGHMIGLFKLLADYAVASGLVSMESNLVVDKVISWIDERSSRRRLPLAEVAAAVRKSPSTVSHVVKRETGMSYKRLVIERKLEAATEMLLESPESSIGEVAEAMGFSDQFQFSKMFRKYRGASPSEFVKRHKY
jgi:Response regulator containing CheY-like receiver domain and AraC-type DNA-binding domain